jgi:hypothetical protein
MAKGFAMARSLTGGAFDNSHGMNPVSKIFRARQSHPSHWRKSQTREGAHWEYPAVMAFEESKATYLYAWLPDEQYEYFTTAEGQKDFKVWLDACELEARDNPGHLRPPDNSATDEAALQHQHSSDQSEVCVQQQHSS